VIVTKHILFPFDGSQQGVQAAPFVRALASVLDARVTLFGVVPPIWDTAPLSTGVMIGDDVAECLRDLKCRLDRSLVDELADVPVTRVVDSGDPAFTIVDFAHASAVDLIMMPTHGYGRFRALLLGSVTAKVLHDARCPVWTAAHTDTQRAPVVPNRILCALDGTPGSVPLLKWAGEFSKVVGASLSLLHVVPPISDWVSLESERALQEQVRDRAFAKVAGFQTQAGLNVPIRVAVGGIVPTVVEEARQEHADLILIGRGSLHSTLGRLRTHAYGIIQQSPCPVMSV
jgi:nucleotide-binding universal stress UspA family protein